VRSKGYDEVKGVKLNSVVVCGLCGDGRVVPLEDQPVTVFEAD
jgi:hypothetical protein